MLPPPGRAAGPTISPQDAERFAHARTAFPSRCADVGGPVRAALNDELMLLRRRRVRAARRDHTLAARPPRECAAGDGGRITGEHLLAASTARQRKPSRSGAARLRGACPAVIEHPAARADRLRRSAARSRRFRARAHMTLLERPSARLSRVRTVFQGPLGAAAHAVLPGLRLGCRLMTTARCCSVRASGGPDCRLAAGGALSRPVAQGAT